jgi:XTP/dITP diphosphohydrolase
MRRLVFATRNHGKLRELRALVAALPIEILSLDEAGVVGEVEEDGLTFADNARKKAEAALAATGLPSLADDSGLVVDALDGAPGVYSARYGGEPRSDARNNAHLLAALAGTPAPRRARFRCVLCLAQSGAPPVYAEGSCEGEILEAPRGEDGFGYDPIFLVEGLGKTMAELSLAEKNERSHRARAMARMAEALARDVP